MTFEAISLADSRFPETSNCGRRLRELPFGLFVKC